MEGKTQRVHKIQVALAEKGSIFSSEEIDEMLTILEGVSLKLIITNIPQAVFEHDIAKEAFEQLFKSFDLSCRFIYLPSFKRALIYVTRPEAGLLARIETQGWKLPENVLAALPQEFAMSNTEGINCYIAQFGDSYESDEEQEDDECDCLQPNFDLSCHTVDNNGSEDNDDNSSKPNCDSKEIVSTHSSSSSINTFLSRISSDISHGSIPDASITSSGTISSANPKNVSTERSICTPECENASEASGDDGSPSVKSTESTHHVCCKIGKRKRPKRCPTVKHLAPPKPPRLFLLSPPASPPVGWEPKPESEPVINYELLQALASLAPGEAFELHPSDQANKHPSIVVTPCQYETTDPNSKRVQIVQTRCPDRKP